MKRDGGAKHAAYTESTRQSAPATANKEKSTSRKRDGRRAHLSLPSINPYLSAGVVHHSTKRTKLMDGPTEPTIATTAPQEDDPQKIEEALRLGKKYKDDPALLFDDNCYEDMRLVLPNLERLAQAKIFPVRSTYKCIQGQTEVFTYTKKLGFEKSMDKCNRTINFSGTKVICKEPLLFFNWLDRKKFGDDNVDARRYCYQTLEGFTLVVVKWATTPTIEQRLEAMEAFQGVLANEVLALTTIVRSYLPQFFPLTSIQIPPLAPTYSPAFIFNPLAPSMPVNYHHTTTNTTTSPSSTDDSTDQSNSPPFPQSPSLNLQSPNSPP